MAYVPVDELGGRPHVIVDGAPRPGTVLTLSHWPGTPTPEGLWSDVSAGIVRHALAGTRLSAVEAVSIDHVDADGVLSLALLCVEGLAAAHGPLPEDAATVGDFGVVHDRAAARVAFAVNALATADPTGRPRGAAVTDALDVLPRIAADPAAYEALWGPEDRAYEAGLDALRRGTVHIEEDPGHDLAVVHVVDDAGGGAAVRWGDAPVHRAVVHTATDCLRVVTMAGGRYELRYRYESWVRLASRRPRPRVDLSAAADELTAAERAGVRWVFDGAGAITGALHLVGEAPSTLAPERFEEVVRRHLEVLDVGAPAWDPYAAVVGGA